jgi:cystathionine beta-lyase
VQVLHPGLPGSPGHEHWARACSDAAGLFAIVLDERFARPQVDAFVDAFKVFRIGYSWAASTSLVIPYDLKTMRAKPRWRGFVVRFSVGLEEVDDLIADCEQALAALHAVG